MKVKAGVNFHNRFDIEVRDAKTGKLKQKGQAENIILDQMYSRLCNFQAYFHSIHFGRGAGTPTPEKNTLFDRISSRQATDEEIIRALPTSKWTRRITLMPEEFVEEVITEVGIGFSATASHLATHAMIKDAEGNPLSIIKTDLDVVVIYATVFITLLPSSEMRWIHSSRNQLLNYLTSHSIFNPRCLVGTIIFPGFDGAPVAGTEDTRNLKNLSVSTDTQLRSRKYSTRFGINDSNIEVKSIELERVFALIEADSPQFTKNIQALIGVGDGEQTTFVSPYGDYLDHRVTLDGTSTDGYSIENRVFPKINNPILSIVDFEAVSENDVGDVVGVPGVYVGGNLNPQTSRQGTFKSRMSLSGCSFTSNGNATFSRRTLFYNTGDNMDFSGQIANAGIIPPTGNDWFRVQARNSSSHSTYSFSDFFIVAPEELTQTKIIFNTPPPEGVLVGFEGTINALPKDENHVIDVTFELQFGEGV